MSIFFHQLVTKTAQCFPNNIAITYQQQQLSYLQLAQEVSRVATKLTALGVCRHDRVATFLPKNPEAVISLFATSQAGAVFVPINPVLKPQQVRHILSDCNVKVLITNTARAKQLTEILGQCPDLITIIVTDANELILTSQQLSLWSTVPQQSTVAPAFSRTDHDMAAILYTSGSTGLAKGVVLSHRNLLCGANSVTQYLHNTSDDNILALLPLSFDYGLSQITTAFSVGAHCILMDYLLPNDVLKAITKHQITGLAAVPPLWAQLVKLNNQYDLSSLRYFTNSGGAMPKAILEQLQVLFPTAQPYLMYGLTEAFRSSYLEPKYIKTHPNSIGKAIPNAELLVVTGDGRIANDNEPGELVHRGPLVSMGYWNAPEKTAQRFKPVATALPQLCLNDIAVFSGDWVTRDSEGFLYFVARQDDMIKSSGYRVSPGEVEDVIYQLSDVVEATVIGLPHPQLGQAMIVVFVTVAVDISVVKTMQAHCRKELANYMQPLKYIAIETMPHNANGKIDRVALTAQFNRLFEESSL